MLSQIFKSKESLIEIDGLSPEQLEYITPIAEEIVKKFHEFKKQKAQRLIDLQDIDPSCKIPMVFYKRLEIEQKEVLSFLLRSSKNDLYNQMFDTEQEMLDFTSKYINSIDERMRHIKYPMIESQILKERDEVNNIMLPQ